MSLVETVAEGKSLSEQAYDRIRHDILHGALFPDAVAPFVDAGFVAYWLRHASGWKPRR